MNALVAGFQAASAAVEGAHHPSASQGSTKSVSFKALQDLADRGARICELPSVPLRHFKQLSVACQRILQAPKAAEGESSAVHPVCLTVASVITRTVVSSVFCISASLDIGRGGCEGVDIKDAVTVALRMASDVVAAAIGVAKIKGPLCTAALIASCSCLTLLCDAFPHFCRKVAISATLLSFLALECCHTCTEPDAVFEVAGAMLAACCNALCLQRRSIDHSRTGDSTRVCWLPGNAMGMLLGGIETVFETIHQESVNPHTQSLDLLALTKQVVAAASPTEAVEISGSFVVPTTRNTALLRAVFSLRVTEHLVSRKISPLVHSSGSLSAEVADLPVALILHYIKLCTSVKDLSERGFGSIMMEKLCNAALSLYTALVKTLQAGMHKWEEHSIKLFLTMLTTSEVDHGLQLQAASTYAHALRSSAVTGTGSVSSAVLSKCVVRFCLVTLQAYTSGHYAAEAACGALKVLEAIVSSCWHALVDSSRLAIERFALALAAGSCLEGVMIGFQVPTAAGLEHSAVASGPDEIVDTYSDDDSAPGPRGRRYFYSTGKRQRSGEGLPLRAETERCAEILAVTSPTRSIKYAKLSLAASASSTCVAPLAIDHPESVRDQLNTLLAILTACPWKSGHGSPLLPEMTCFLRNQPGFRGTAIPTIMAPPTALSGLHAGSAALLWRPAPSSAHDVDADIPQPELSQSQAVASSTWPSSAAPKQLPGNTASVTSRDVPKQVASILEPLRHASRQPVATAQLQPSASGHDQPAGLNVDHQAEANSDDDFPDIN
jgi:hypothetical protein